MFSGLTVMIAMLGMTCSVDITISLGLGASWWSCPRCSPP